MTHDDTEEIPGRITAVAEHRGRLTAVAYAITGSWADAEDVVQDALLRWAAADREDVEVPLAWLTTVVTRRAVDELRSARHRRETYVGPWLPEPLLRVDDDPADVVAEAEALTLAFLAALEVLSPVERAVLVLRDAFDLDYAEIAPVVGRSVEACRKAASRARGRVAAAPRRLDRDVAAEDATLAALVAAVAARDVARVAALLEADVVATSDGGGVVRAAPRPIVGATRVARFLVGLARAGGDAAEVRLGRANGDPALVVDLAGERTVMAFEIHDGRVRAVRAQRNPAKLVAADRAWTGRAGRDAPS